MKMFKLFSRAAVLGLLLAITIPVQADDLQDANKLFKQGLHAQALDKVKATLIPAEHILLFTMEPIFASNSTGLRGVQWMASDGSARAEKHPAVNGDVTAFSMIHWRRQIIASTYYHVQVYQNSGAPLNLDFFDFGAFRFR